MKRLLILTAILTLMVGAANSQVLKPVKWQISFKKVSEGVYDIICKATIESGWHLRHISAVRQTDQLHFLWIYSSSVRSHPVHVPER